MLKNIKSNYKFARGFTTIELIVSIGLFVLLVAALGTIFISSLNSANVAENQSRLKSKSQIIMARLGKELRGAIDVKNLSSDWSSNELLFKLDTDADDSADQVIRYYFDKNNNTLSSYKHNNSSYPSNWSSYLNKTFINGNEIKIIRQKDGANKLDVFKYDHELKLLKIRFNLVYTYKNSHLQYPVNNSISLRNIGNVKWKL